MIERFAGEGLAEAGRAPGEPPSWRAFAALAQSLFQESDQEAIARIFLAGLPSVLPVSFCAIALCPPRRGEYWWAAGQREAHPLSARLLDRIAALCQRELAGQLFVSTSVPVQQGRLLILDSRRFDLTELDGGPIAAVGVQTERAEFGILLLGMDGREGFSTDEQLCLRLLANQLAYALESAALSSDALHRARELALIYQTGQRITQLLNLQELMAQLVVAVSETFGYESVTLLLLEEGTNELVVEATHGLRREKHIGFRIPVTYGPEGGIVGWVAYRGKPYLAPDVDKEPRYLKTVEETRSELAVPLKIKERVIGVLDVQSSSVGAVTTNDCYILETLADQVAIALENARLYKDLRRAHAEIQQTASQLQRLLARTVQIQEQERRRIAADIHDHVSQLLYAAVYEAEGALQSLPADLASVEESLRNIQISLNRAMSEMRKTIFNLWPTSLDEMGLLPAVEAWVSRFEKLSGVSCELKIRGTPFTFSSPARITIYRILQEALHNIQKHAAASKARVTFSFDRSKVRLWIYDNGRGFDMREGDGEAEGHLGLISMRERARSIGGRFTLKSRTGKGTLLVFEFPQQSIEERAP